MTADFMKIADAISTVAAAQRMARALELELATAIQRLSEECTFGVEHTADGDQLRDYLGAARTLLFRLSDACTDGPDFNQACAVLARLIEADRLRLDEGAFTVTVDGSPIVIRPKLDLHASAASEANFAGVVR